MQYYFYFYAAISCIALGVHLIVNWRQLMDWRGVTKRVGGVEFRVLLVCMSLFFASDALWGLLAEWKFVGALYIDTVAFFLLLALTFHAWTRFVVAYLRMVKRLRAIMLWTGHAMLAYYIVILAVNHFTGAFFDCRADNIYVEGFMRTPTIVLLSVFNAFCSSLMMVKFMRLRDGFQRRNMMVFVFGITMVAAVMLQMLNALLPLYAIGFLIGGCLLHVFVVEDEREKMYQKVMLAHEFEVQLNAERSASRERGKFFSSVSHDIRTPLNAIVGFAELLEQGVSDEGERMRYISSIRSSSKVLARLVDDILDLSKLECGKLDIIKEPTDVPVLIREVIAACEIARSRKSLALKTEIAEMPPVNVDPQRIRQLLFNLLSNAYKYTDRGTVTVSAGWHDGTLTLAVSDTGKGISKENLKRILQPFVQIADRNHRDGTGLGLPICNKLASLMNGELTVSSQVNVGSTFTVTLRDVEVADLSAVNLDDKPAAGRFARSPERVLVVDDSPVNRTVLKALLAKFGVTDVTLAENGREALDMLKRGAKFDLVLTDLWMPEMDGSGLMRAIRADPALSHLPVYLLTADVEARTQAESDGFTGILIKPITLKRLKPLFE